MAESAEMPCRRVPEMMRTTEQSTAEATASQQECCGLTGAAVESTGEAAAEPSCLLESSERRTKIGVVGRQSAH
jgi:hypothetical protein